MSELTVSAKLSIPPLNALLFRFWLLSQRVNQVHDILFILMPY